MKQFSIFRTGAIAALALCSVLTSVSRADTWDRKTIITIDGPLEVPGATLQPGKYVMKLFNSANNRHIVQIMNEREDKLLALTFTIPAQRLDASDKTILTKYEGSNGQPEALRTWFYPGDLIGQEFLYPHDQALRISQRSSKRVPEASATESAAILSKDVDSPEVNLKTEMRTSTTEAPAATTAPALVAQVEPPPAPQPAPMIAQVQAPPVQVAQSQTNQNSVPPAASTLPDTLPQTAGEGPLVALLGTLSLAFAFTLWSVRRRREQ